MDFFFLKKIDFYLEEFFYKSFLIKFKNKEKILGN